MNFISVPKINKHMVTVQVAFTAAARQIWFLTSFYNVVTAWWALYDAEPFKNQYVSEAKSRSRKAFFSTPSKLLAPLLNIVGCNWFCIII